MTPADHGYRQCVRCGAWRMPGTTREVDWVCLPGDQVARGDQCTDDEVCSRLAGVGAGKLDADEGAGAVLPPALVEQAKRFAAVAKPAPPEANVEDLDHGF